MFTRFSCVFCLLISLCDLFCLSSGQCNVGETELRVEVDNLSGGSTSIDIDLFDAMRTTKYADLTSSGSYSATFNGICVPDGGCYYLSSERFGAQERYIVKEIDGGSETTILFDNSPFHPVADISIFCLTSANFVAPTSGTCGYNEAEVTITVLEDPWPRELGWWVFDSDNSDKVIWYDSNIGNTASIESRTSCLSPGNYEFLLVNAHEHGLHSGYYQIIVDGKVVRSVTNPRGHTHFNTFVVESNCPEECVDSPCSQAESGACQVYNEGSGCSQCNIGAGYFKKSPDYPCLQCQEVFGHECLHCSDGQGCQQCANNFDRVFDEDCELYRCEPNPCYFSTNFCAVCNNGECSQCQQGYVKLNNDPTKCVHCQNTFGEECLFCDNGNGCQQCQEGHYRVFDNILQAYVCDDEMHT